MNDITERITEWTQYRTIWHHWSESGNQNLGDLLTEAKQTIEQLREVNDELRLDSNKDFNAGRRQALVEFIQAAKTVKLRCEWKYDDTHDKYDTECGGAWQFNDGDLSENRLAYCPFCGVPVVESEAA